MIGHSSPMEHLDSFQPWYRNQSLVVVTPAGEANAVEVLPNGRTDETVSLRHGTPVTVVDLRIGQWTDVQTFNGRRYRMLSNAYLRE